MARPNRPHTIDYNDLDSMSEGQRCSSFPFAVSLAAVLLGKRNDFTILGQSAQNLTEIFVQLVY